MSWTQNIQKIGINLFHVLVVLPLLTYVGVLGVRGQTVPRNIFILLIVLAVIGFATQLALIYTKLKSDSK